MNSQDNPFSISILGCGWYGLALAKSLLEKGYQVKGSSTSTEKLQSFEKSGIEGYRVKFSAEDSIYDPEFFQSDVLFIAIPPKRKSGEANYYPQKIESICKAVAKSKIKHLILISSTGVYANTGRELNELDTPEPDSDSGKALLAAENIVRTQKSYTITILRFGGLFGPDRNPGKFLKHKRSISNGLAPVNMIHLNDCLAISHAILEQKAFGKIYNACSPEHPSRIDFYTYHTSLIHEAAPDFIQELKEWKIVNSINLPPTIFKEKLIP